MSSPNRARERVSSVYGAPATPITLDEFRTDSGSVLVGSYAGAMSSSSPDAASDMKWDAIVVTSAHMNHALAHVKRLQRRQRNGDFDKNVLIIASPDPDGSFIGSGGATMNALLHVTEHLSARAGATFVDSATLADRNVLILHVDGESRRLPLFSSSATSVDGSAVELMITNITKIRKASSAPAGTWICSVEASLSFNGPAPALDFSREGFTAFSQRVPAETVACMHGTYKARASDGRVLDWGHKLSIGELASRGFVVDGADAGDGSQLVQMACGIVFASTSASRFLVDTHAVRPFDACTYMGQDDGAAALSFSLFNDLFSVLAAEATMDSLSGTTHHHLWNHFRLNGGLELHIAVPPPGTMSYAYRRNTKECISEIALGLNDSGWIDHSVAMQDKSSAKGVVNSVLHGNGAMQTGAIVEHSRLAGQWIIGAGSFVSGLTLDADSELTIPPATVLQCVPLNALNSSASGAGATTGSGDVVYVLCGTSDEFAVEFAPSKGADGTPSIATFGNMPWSKGLFSVPGIEPRDVWPDGTRRNLFNAKLFVSVLAAERAGCSPLPFWILPSTDPPVAGELERWRFAERLSISDITRNTDMEAMYCNREQIATAIGGSTARSVLLAREDGDLLHFYQWCARHEQWGALPILDAVAAEAKGEDIAARAMAHIADLLACFAGQEGGLRSGPAQNKAWQPALDKLRKGQRREAVDMMACVRADWIDSPANLIRAARHYEGAGAILVRQAVESCRDFIAQTATEPCPIGQMVVAESAARIDLAGGWTDTPPITFECGGVVANAAVLVDGERPIGASAARIPEFELHLVVGDREPVIVTTLDGLKDHCVPSAPAALLKAGVLALGLVALPPVKGALGGTPSSSFNGVIGIKKAFPTLAEQLRDTLGSGLRVCTWSTLPQGSGMGTSSILAGAMLFAMAQAIGKPYADDASLMHGVLVLEQLLTTGGGWQDQVGGVMAGIKITSSEASLPLRVMPATVEAAPATIDALSKRIVLVYTGRTRLARNLLQTVIRRWYERLPEIMVTTAALKTNAFAVADAVRAGDVAAVGACVTKYWAHKKAMAEGCEPAFCAKILAACEPLLHGASMAGAGGGGFMFLITKEPNMIPALRELLSKSGIPEASDLTYHTGIIDTEGLKVTVKAAS